jgi:cyclophilin family peptidyl-prolyl cis-trans isomerase
MKRRQFCQIVAGTALCGVSFAERAAAAAIGDEGSTVYQWSAPPPMTINPDTTYSAVIRTNLGEMIIELYPKDAPNTVNNFVFLAREGFYNFVVFHRIISGFMVQTGDPTGTGRGGPGYRFEDELSGPQTYTRGTLAMANAGPNTQGSQFFICHGSRTEALPKRYTIFGKVTTGLDVLDAIANVEVKASTNGEVSAPVDPPVIESIAVVEGSVPEGEPPAP